MQEERKAFEEAQRLQQEEEERREREEEERIRQAELAAIAAAEAQREQERLQREELKRQGKLLSKSERERQERNRLKLEQLLKANNGEIHVSAMEETPANKAAAEEQAAKKKKPVYEKKKKTNVMRSEGPKTDSPLKLAVEKVEEDVVDDWEQALASSSSDDEDGPTSTTKQGAGRVASVTKGLEKTSLVSSSGEEPQAKATAAKSKVDRELRSPICCILGHVDTGKTKLLDKIRQTNVQEGEAGGITQQIGATYFPIEAIREKTAHAMREGQVYSVPGMLVIDTPGHESFTNLRSRGSSLCNMAILVVDIMHGLEPQTIESINLLKQRKTPFVVALNKIDRLYGWKAMPHLPVEEALAQQSASVQREFENRVASAQVAFAEQGLNAEIFWRNDDLRRTVSLVPTSAISGDGIGDLLALILDLCQRMMGEHLRYLSDLQCTVLEVKVVEGLGTTIDVILSNGVLREGDRIVLCGLSGPIVTNIRALLTPQPLRELRIKSQYVHHKEVKAALGVKISAPDLEGAVAGSQLLVLRAGAGGAEEEEAKETVMGDLTAMLESVDSSGPGVCVQASTLGSLEALLAFLKQSKIPVSGINIGPVHKRDIIRASVMLEQEAKEYACLLAFDVKIDREVEELADELDVRIFKADIIYHLFDQFTAYMNGIMEQKKRELAPQVVFPCVLRIQPGCIFNKRDPIILGVSVEEGSLRVGCPLSVQSKEHGLLSLGRVASIELNHKPMQEAKKGGPSVAIKIEHASYEPTRMAGRHFTETDTLFSRISRQSIDVLKDNFREQMSKEDWALIVKLKKVFNIQ